jgi:hypothetical protein
MTLAACGVVGAAVSNGWPSGAEEGQVQGSPVQAGIPGTCRGAIAMPHAPLKANPCIRVVGDQLELTSHVTALKAGKVTVFVWLTNGATYRPDVSPHACTWDLTAGESKTCTLRARPDRPGTHWVAATEAETGVAEYPPGWGNFPDTSGTQSGHDVTWPLSKETVAAKQ